MLSWLVEAGYLAGNPLALRRRRKRVAPPGSQPVFADQQWEAVKITIESMPMGNDRERLHAARVRWRLSLLYIGGLRVSEICGTTMGDFFGRRSADGRERWWLRVNGKGDKSRLIPATGELMNELMRYRKVNRLGSMAVHEDRTPLLVPVIGRCKPMARSAVHEIVKGVIRDSAQRLRLQGPEYEASASLIWNRHPPTGYATRQAAD